jgi:serine/threonine protein kinase
VTEREEDPRAPDSLDLALEEYRELWTTGESIDPDGFCAKHPGDRDALRGEIDQFLYAAEGLRELRSGPPDTDAPPPEIDRRGTQLGDYRLVREIGRGGMGVVFEAEQISLRRTVALKVLPAHVTLRPSSVERFQREASTAARLRHEGIVDVHAVGEQEETHYFAMSFVEGAPLDAVIDHLREAGGATVEGMDLREVAGDLAHRHRAREAEEIGVGGHPEVWEGGYPTAIARIVLQVADALEYAHRADVVHRDVKPSNILLRPDGTAILTDFGLAREAGLPSLTVTGQFAGTPHYVSPEQAEAHRGAVDARSDVFSLGVTLYELLTLERPFDGESTGGVLQQVLSRDDVTPLRRRNRRVPRDLETICLTAMEKAPERRYQSAGDLAGDLRRFLDDRPVRARPVGPIGRFVRTMRRHPLRSAALAVILVLIVFTLGQQYLHTRRLEAEKTAVLERQQQLEWVLEFTTRFLGFSTVHPSQPLGPSESRMAPEKRGETLIDPSLMRHANDIIGLVASSNPNAQALLYRTMGTLCRQVGYYEMSKEYLDSACRAYEQLDEPDEFAAADWLHRLAVMYHDRSVLEDVNPEATEGLFRTAEDTYLATQQRLEALIEGGPSPTREAAQGELQSVRQNRGTLHYDWSCYQWQQAIARPDPRESERWRRSAIEHEATAEWLLRSVLRQGEEMSGANPRRSDGELSSTRLELARLLYRRGSLAPYREGEPEVAAERDLEEARAQIERALGAVSSEESRIRLDRRYWRAVLLSIEDLRADLSEQPRLSSLATDPIDLPPLYCLAHRTGEAEESGAREGMRDLLIEFDSDADSGHSILVPFATDASMSPTTLAPTVSEGRVCWIEEETRESRESRGAGSAGFGRWAVRVLDPRGGGAPLTLFEDSGRDLWDPIWRPDGRKIYFCMSRHREKPDPFWTTDDLGIGIFWVDPSGPERQTPRVLIHHENQVYRSPRIDPAPPHTRMVFLHYPWTHGSTASDLWIATLSDGGSRLIDLDAVIADTVGDNWCAFAPDGQSILLRQTFTFDKFGRGAGRRVSLLSLSNAEVTDETSLVMGDEAGRISHSDSGFSVLAGGSRSEEEAPALWIFDEEMNRVRVVSPRQLGLEGWRLTEPLFVR